MTLDEAQKLAEIAATVDSGCSVCVEDMVLQLNETFPEFKWEMLQPWYKIKTIKVMPT